MEKSKKSSEEFILINDFPIKKEAYDLLLDGQVKKAEKLVAKEISAKSKKRFKADLYIQTDEEMAQEEKRKAQMQEELNKKAIAMYLRKIDKNGIVATIDKKQRKNTFQYKNWPKYNIDTSMDLSFRSQLTLHEEEILKNCAEAGLHFRWIAIILGTEEQFMRKTCKRRWFESVFATTQRHMQKAPVIRVLDDEKLFVIEKPNHLLKQ